MGSKIEILVKKKHFGIKSPLYSLHTDILHTQILASVQYFLICSSSTWMKEQSTSLLGGTTNTLELFVALQKCLNRRNFLKFSKGQCRVLPLGKHNPRHQLRLGADLQGSSSAEKELVDTELSLGQQCPCGQESQWHPGGNRKIIVSRLGLVIDSARLLSPGEVSSGLLCPVLGSSVQERKRTPGDCPVEGYKND